MEIILINESKLKVMLTPDDLESFEIRTEELDYSNTETKRMFWDILNRAKHSIGFDTDGQRVLVQLYPSHSGGCEMFITKLGSVLSCAEGEGKENVKEQDVQTPLHCKTAHRPIGDKGRTGVFRFESLEILLQVCRRLLNVGYTGDSAAYRSDDGRYYLRLSGLDPTGFPVLDEYSFLPEYGSPCSPEALSSYINEHGKTVCPENAVEKLSHL